MPTPTAGHVNAPRGAVQALNFDWSVGSLAWVAQIQPATSGGGGGAVTIANGADVAEGSTTDVAVTSDASGTLSAKLRGLVAIFASVWDSANGRLKVKLDEYIPQAGGKLPVQDLFLEGGTRTGGTSFDSLNLPRAFTIGTVRSDTPVSVAPVDQTFGTPITDGGGGLYTVDTPYTTVLDFDASNNPIYIGRAHQGSAKSAASWQIKKLTFNASNLVTDIQYAAGDSAFNHIWNNRASLTYS